MKSAKKVKSKPSALEKARSQLKKAERASTPLAIKRKLKINKQEKKA